MAIVDYKNSKKNILIEESLNSQICLIESVKMNFEELKVRVSLNELKCLNSIVYDLFNESQKENYIDCMDRLISTSLYYAIDDNYKFDINTIKSNLMCLSEYINPLKIPGIYMGINKKIKIKEKIVKMEVHNGRRQ